MEEYSVADIVDTRWMTKRAYNGDRARGKDGE